MPVFLLWSYLFWNITILDYLYLNVIANMLKYDWSDSCPCFSLLLVYPGEKENGMD